MCFTIAPNNPPELTDLYKLEEFEPYIILSAGASP